jgi:serine/threonine-protein kinase HipA
MSLRDLKRVDVAHVFKGGRHAATLTRDRGRCTLTYDPGFDGAPLAWTLPLHVPPVVTSAGAVPPFFAGLLPEGRRLSALQRALKTSADDDFSLLLAIGHETIGDVTVLPGDHASTATPRSVERASLSETTFAELYARVLAPEPEDRVGLPGVQSKFSEGMISLPLTWGERPSILKLNPPDFPGVVENEELLLDLAAAAGIRVPEHCIVVDAEGASGLLVARFDRVQCADGGWRALAQEDACQVLGLYPADKYRPATEEVVQALSQCCDAPIVAAREYIRMVVFAYLTCNGDAHAKNFSVLRDPTGEWRPTPAYDLPTTYPYGDTTMALTIDGRDRQDIGRRHVLALALSCGLPTRAAERVVDAVADAVEAHLDRFAGLPFDSRRLHKLGRAVRYRLDRVRRG